MDLVLYEKPECHLCEGLLEKLEAIAAARGGLTIAAIERRDITTRDDWSEEYRYEIPVLLRRDRHGAEQPIPRPSPRLTVAELEEWLQKSVETS